MMASRVSGLGLTSLTRHCCSSRFTSSLLPSLGALSVLPSLDVVGVRTMARKAKKSKIASAAAASSEGKAAALSAALDEIQSQFGAGSIMRLGDQAVVQDVEVISTGSLSLDRAIGIGGLPRGRVIEIYGPESSGKTTLALHVVAQAQKQGLNCTFIDVEHALDTTYARNIGVDLDSLLLAQPDAGEAALGICDTLVRSGSMDVVVVDSVAALVTQAELQGEMGDHHMATQARLMSQALRKLNASLAHSSCMIIFINQIRSKIGVLFGSPDVTSGGNALKFYASVRMDIRRIGQIKDGDAVVGNRTRVKVIKNKLAPPFREAEFDMTFGFGVSRLGELVDIGTELGLLKKSGAWYSWAGEGGAKVGQGREKAKLYFEENPEQAEKLETEIRDLLKSGPADDAVHADDDELDKHPLEIFAEEGDEGYPGDDASKTVKITVAEEGPIVAASGDAADGGTGDAPASSTSAA